MERVRTLKITVLGMALVLAAALPSVADTHYVSSGQSIQAAINAASNGDQIEVAPGTYHEAIDFKGKAVRLYSSGGPDVTTIDGNNAVLLIEDFNDGTYLPEWQIIDQGTTSAPSAWSAATGEMVQTSNIYTEPTSNPAMRGTFALWQNGMSWTDYTVTLTMKSDDNDAMGLMFHYQYPNNYYRFAWLNQNHSQGVGRRQLGKTVNGAHTVLFYDDVPYTVGQTYQVRIEWHRQLISIYINDVPFVTEGGGSVFNYGSIALFCWGNVGTHFDNISVVGRASHVVQCVSGEDDNTILEGFTITGGYAYGADTNGQSGGGMYNNNSSPTVKNCIFTGNTAKYGGGMYNEHSNPIVSDCNFIGNTAAYIGGGIYNYHYSNPTVTDCTFSGNTADYGGCLMNNDYCSPTVSNCAFSGNTATYNGGGMENLNYSDPIMTNCTLKGNTAIDEGGGMYNNYSSPTVTDCNFSGNSASSGGGMFNYVGSPVVTNCTFSGNTASIGGGLKNVEYSHPFITNCDFVVNTASATGGGLANGQNSDCNLTNCIIWGNTPNQIYNTTSIPIVTYCDIQGGYSGTGNINADPCFIDADANDFRLRPDSPCIDAGNNAAVPGGITTDLNGLPRFVDSCRNDTGSGTPPIVDMGAYEFLSSDIDSNAIVDFEDFCLFSENWLVTECGTCSGADLTCDGDVGFDDLQVLVSYWLAGAL